MGTAGDPIPCDSEHEVTSQFRVVHRTGDVAGKPIEIELDAEEELPTRMDRGECSRPKMERGTTDVVYPSLSCYLGMTDFNLGTTPDYDFFPAESSYAPASLRRTSRATGEGFRSIVNQKFPTDANKKAKI
jgi:hypothetical protein